MECPVCACETFRVVGNPVRGMSVDLRTYCCVDCKTTFTAETKLIEIMRGGQAFPISMARDKDFLSSLQDEYFENKQRAIRVKRKAENESLF